MAFELNTLHLFGYGEVQVIGKDGETSINKKVATSALSHVQPLVNNMYSKRRPENKSPNEYHAINIFNGMFADYNTKGDFSNWRVQWYGIDQQLIDNLVNEVLAYTPPVTE